MKRLLARLFSAAGRNATAARLLGVRFGAECRILTRYFGSEPFLIHLGDRVTLSRDVMFINHDGATCLARDDRGRRQKFGRITIGSDVFVGARTMLLPGVKIGDRCVIGAGSVVTRSVPPGTVAAGNPARAICTFDELMDRMLRLYPAQNDLPHPSKAVQFALAALVADAPMITVSAQGSKGRSAPDGSEGTNRKDA